MAGSKTSKLPKRVAGVKLPRSVRESGGKIRAIFTSPMAQGVLEKVISAAVIAFVAKLGDSAAARDAGASVRDKAKNTADEFGRAIAPKPRKAKAKAVGTRTAAPKRKARQAAD